MNERLGPEDGRTLLRLARAAIGDAVRGERALDDLLTASTLGPGLEAPRGVFVTLRAPGEQGGGWALRGCIGTLVAGDPLYRAVIVTAPKAALEDPRFPPLTATELPDLSIEVSALTPPQPLAGPEHIVLGRDGVELLHDGRHSVFLPQVAVQQGWSTLELLEHLASKAGLAKDAWRAAELRVFRTEVFEE